MSKVMIPKANSRDTAIINLKNPPPSAENATKALKRFEWLVSFLICNYKFVHQVLGMMVKRAKPGYGTIGVRVTPDGKFELVYDPDWISSLKDEEATYVFYHEILHLVLHHCTKRKFDDNDIGNIAHDLAVNELIPVTPKFCTPPVDANGNLMGTFVSQYKKIPMYKDIEEMQTAEWYYDFLMKKTKKKGTSYSVSFDDHGEWQEHEIADERVRAEVRRIDLGALWGNVSQTTIEKILAAQIQKVNWRNKIRIWFGNMAWKHKQTTYKRPNRRTGYLHPGSKKVHVDRWLIAADTSGSIDSGLLAQWLGVVNQLVEELPIDFMQFDCEKTEDPKPYERRKVSLNFLGRGGTNFQPVINIVNEKKYKGVMILTDGEACAPTKPLSAQVLWVLPADKRPPVEWGDRVYLVRHV